MTQLILEVPDLLAQRLAEMAAEQMKSVEQVALERLSFAIASPGDNLAARYERFLQESGLFIDVSEEQKNRYQPVSEQRLKELAAKLGAAGPLSKVILEERGKP